MKLWIGNIYSFMNGFAVEGERNQVISGGGCGVKRGHFVR